MDFPQIDLRDKGPCSHKLVALLYPEGVCPAQDAVAGRVL